MKSISFFPLFFSECCQDDVNLPDCGNVFFTIVAHVSLLKPLKRYMPRGCYSEGCSNGTDSWEGKNPVTFSSHSSPFFTYHQVSTQFLWCSTHLRDIAILCLFSQVCDERLNTGVSNISVYFYEQFHFFKGWKLTNTVCFTSRS